MNKQKLPKPSAQANKPEWVNYLSQFMSRKEASRIALEVRNKLILKGLQVSIKNNPEKTPLQILKAKYPKISKRNDALQRRSLKEAQKANKRIKNWLDAKAKCSKTNLGGYEAIGAGYYKGKFKGYKIWNYQPTYTSYYRIGPSGKKIIYVYGFDNPTKKIISAPKGMVFQRDNNGLMLKRLSDGMDYHPSTEELLVKNFATLIRKKMATNFKAQLMQKRSERQNKFLDKVFHKDIKTTMVTLNDSRKAGNCIEGSLVFAERRLGISRKEILNGGHLFHVCAEKLVKTGDQRAIRAARVAWERETTVSI